MRTGLVINLLLLNSALLFFAALSLKQYREQVKITPTSNGFFQAEWGKKGIVIDSGVTVGELMKEAR